MRTVKRKLVVGILAHVDAGKTTLSETFLYAAGKLRKRGRVDHGDAFLDTDEVEELMLHFLPHYMEDLRHGAYTLPRNTEQSLRHIFTVGAMKEYFYENMPSMANPLGLGHKAMPLACKVQNLLIADFLHYLALRHDVYLSTASSDIKKNSMTKP